ATPVVLDRRLVRADAFLLRTVEIIRVRMASLLARFDESIEQHIALHGIGNAERPIATVKSAIAVLVAFRASEIGQHIRKAPAFKAHLTPEIIVARVATNIDHAIDRGRTAKHLAARPEKLAVVQMRLAFSVI